MRTLKVHIVGTKETIMHNGRLADPLHPIAQEIKAISGKRKKTDQDYKVLSELEVLGGLYYNEELKSPVWPAANIHAMLAAAAKRNKAAPVVKSSVSVLKDAVLEYDGPKDPKVLATSENFVDRRRCGVNGKAIFRSRPIFKNWALTFYVDYDENVVNRRDLEDWIALAGSRIGLSDHRPYYGLFRIVSVEDVSSQPEDGYQRIKPSKK